MLKLKFNQNFKTIQLITNKNINIKIFKSYILIHSKDLEKTVLDMKKTVDEWKEAEGDRKSELLEKLRELNKRKAELEAELNDAVAGKDHDLQLALKEAEELAYLELDVKNIFENEQA